MTIEELYNNNKQIMMTIEDLYNWAIENGYENYRIISDVHLGITVIESDIVVDNENKFIYL